MAEHTSEVARLRNQIEAEHVAAQRGLQGYAIVTRHQFINTFCSTPLSLSIQRATCEFNDANFGGRTLYNAGRCRVLAP